jgi:hypothetical protein
MISVKVLRNAPARRLCHALRIVYTVISCRSVKCLIRVVVFRTPEEKNFTSEKYRCLRGLGTGAVQQQIAIALAEILSLHYVDLRSSFSTPMRGGLLDCDDLGRYGE